MRRLNDHLKTKSLLDRVDLQDVMEVDDAYHKTKKIENNCRNQHLAHMIQLSLLLVYLVISRGVVDSLAPLLMPYKK